MTMYQSGLAEVVRRDPRYPYEAYEFLYAALAHTLQLLGKPERAEGQPASAEHHVTGPQLLEGIRDLALREFGFMARTVFRLWGIQRTDDFGEMVFNLIECKLMSKSEDDQLRDFHDIYDLDQVFVREFRIQIDEAE